MTVDIRVIVRWPRAEREFAKYSQSDMAELTAFVKANGPEALPPLVTAPDFRLVDGYNRLTAYEAAGVTQVHVQVWSYSGDEQMFRHSILLNAKRRHLDSATLALKGADYRDSLEVEAAERANRARAEAARNQPRNADGTMGTGPTTGVVEPDKRYESSTERAAKAVGVSPATIRKVSKVRDTGDAELLEAMQDHTLSIAKAAAMAPMAPEQRHAVIQAARSDTPTIGAVAAAMHRTGPEHFIAGCVDAMQALQKGGTRTPWAELTEDEYRTCLSALGGLITEAQKWHAKAKEYHDGKADGSAG